MTGIHLASEACLGEPSTMEHVQRETGHIDDQNTLMDNLNRKEMRIETETRM
jgi:hypothetical protein